VLRSWLLSVWIGLEVDPLAGERGHMEWVGLAMEWVGLAMERVGLMALLQQRRKFAFLSLD
jgi:hypothetical protein